MCPRIPLIIHLFHVREASFYQKSKFTGVTTENPTAKKTVEYAKNLNKKNVKHCTGSYNISGNTAQIAATLAETEYRQLQH
jgi:hypothetical protein